MPLPLPFTTPPGVISGIASLEAGQGDQNDPPDSKPEASDSKPGAPDPKTQDANEGSTSDSDYLKHWYTVSLGLCFIVVAIVSEVMSKLRGKMAGLVVGATRLIRLP